MMNPTPMDDRGNMDVLNYYKCMNKIVSNAAQSRTYSEAVEIGVYFEKQYAPLLRLVL